MGSMLQFFDFNQANSSKKLVANKRQPDGFDAPRNSLEFSKASRNYDVIQEDIPYSCQVKQQSSKMNFRSNQYQVKRMIDEELPKRTGEKRSTPSVVARLMGMDALPSDTKPVIQAKEWKDEKPRSSLPRKEPTKLSSSYHTPYVNSVPIKKPNHDLLAHDIKLGKPLHQEHPQEELLQKFKKDFEAWQESKAWESRKSLEVDNYLQQIKVDRVLAQECLNKERMARYSESRTYATHKKATDPRVSILRSQSRTNARESYMNEHLALTKLNETQDQSFSPTKIVILKPSMEMSGDVQGSFPGSPEILENEVSMQCFLEEVKEKLKSEILGKSRNNSIPRDIYAENSFGERSGDTKHFARHVAKEIRESITRDLGSSLIRSESTRSYRSEFEFNGPEINRDTKKLLSERLKYVVGNATDVFVPQITKANSRFVQERVKSQSMHDFSKSVKRPDYWDEKKPLSQLKVPRFDKNGVFNTETASPRNLVRSLSAPVSGTAFAKLLLEDQHILTGAHIRRKHEASEHSSPESRGKKRDGFNLKGTVSTLKQNFSLKGKFFGKKTQSTNEWARSEFDSFNALVTVPSVVARVGTVHDNSTEVPPSPASVCSSSLDEFCRPGVPSPVSPLQASFIEELSLSKVSTESSAIVPEPTDLQQHVKHGVFEDVETEEISDKDGEVEEQAQAYIRDILVTAGLYEGEIFDESFPLCDASTNQISSWVFEEVEDAYKQKEKSDESLIRCGDANISRKLLFDITNEAFPHVLKRSTSSSFNEWVLGPKRVLRRRKLLDDLWRQNQMIIKTLSDEPTSVDYMLSKDVRMDRWCTSLHEDHYVTGRKVELLILGDLIDEIVGEMSSSIGL